MELGLTIPLERFLKCSAPPYGLESDRRFCWDLHCIDLRGRKSLLSVHCHSRYTFVLFDLTAAEWVDLPNTFLDGLRQSLTAIGVEKANIDHYLLCTGNCTLTKTHGRREVAFLNRAWEDVLRLEYAVDPDAKEQPFLDYGVNTKSGRCAGFEGIDTALERINLSLSF